MSRQHLRNFMGLIALSFAFWYTAGPYSILRCYLGNPSDFDVVLGDFLWMIVLGTLLLTIAAAGALLLIPSLRRKGTKSIWYAALLGITAATWIQITVLNTRLPLIDGNKPDFGLLTTESLISLAGWFLTVFLLIALQKVSRQGWTTVAAVVMRALIVMNTSSLASLLLGADQRIYQRDDYSFSYDDEWKLSNHKNIVMMIFDTLDNQTLATIVRDYPEEAECLKDFTFYTNADSTYYPTYPSVLHMLTGYDLDPGEDLDYNFDKAWGNERTVSAYASLAEKGYISHLYFPRNDDYVGGAERASRFFENASSENTEWEIYKKRIVIEFSALALYEALPYPMKDCFYDETTDVKTCARRITGDGTFENYALYEQLVNEGITVDSKTEKSFFNTLYFRGIHTPLYNDENCVRVKDTKALDEIRTARGCLKLISEYIGQLKEKGIYERTALLILADHGSTQYRQPVFLIKHQGEATQEALEYNASPVSYCDLLNTILIEAGVQPSEGTSIYDFQETDHRTRTLYWRDTNWDYPFVHKYHTNGLGKANVYVAYTYDGDYSTLTEMCRNGEYTEIIPMKETIH